MIIVSMISIWTHVEISYSQTKYFDLVLEGIHSVNSNIHSGSGTILYEYTLQDSLNSVINGNEKMVVINNSNVKRKYIYYFEGRKKRYDIYTNSYSRGGISNKHIDKYAYDDEKTTILNLIDNKKVISQIGTVDYGKKYDFVHDPLKYGMILQKSFMEYIKDDINILSSEEIIFDNKKCILFIGSDFLKKTNIKFYFAEEYSYQPIYIESNGTYKMQYKVSYFKSDNSYYPKHIEIQAFKKTNNIDILYAISTIDVQDDFKINNEIDNSNFEIQFPKGIKIIEKH